MSGRPRDPSPIGSNGSETHNTNGTDNPSETLTVCQQAWAALGFRRRVPGRGIPAIARSEPIAIGILPMLGAPRPVGYTTNVSLHR